MTSFDSSAYTWLTIPDLVDELGISQSAVRRFLEDNVLAGMRIEGIFKVPSDFLLEGEPLASLQGTIVLLRDCGFSADDAVQWLLEEEESLGVSPVAALTAGRKAEVRRVAQALL